eukprot:scaffold98033_cov23-Cyclotella_meneghiniana.AAC.4
MQKHDSVSVCLAKHVSLLDEMGRYALDSLRPNNGKEANSSTESNKVSVTQHPTATAPTDEPQCQNIIPQSTEDKVEHEIKSFVNSILCHMIASPASNADHHLPIVMSVSGLIHVLLEKFNTLFHDCSNTNRQESRVDINMSVNQKQDNDTVHSWRAILYLLHVLHDTLSLSAKGRDDLRLRFYNARQSVDSGDLEMNTAEKKADRRVHPRIDGLPSLKTEYTPNTDRKETLWNSSCRFNANEGYSWDSSTINLFYTLLVKLMMGLQAIDEDKRFAQPAQIKAIELISRLMSDAPPYNHFESTKRNKTPYHLWKFWFDSLFPTHSKFIGFRRG